MGMALPGSPPCPKFLGGWGLHFGTTGFGVQEWGLSSFHRLCSLGTPRHKRGVISQRHFHLENRLPAPSLAPKPGWGGGGQRGARGAMMSHGKRRQEEAGCLRAACLPSAQDTATAGKSATFLETFFKADQRCREATAKQQQLMIPIPLGPVSLAGLPPPTPGCLWGPWQSRVLSWQPLAPRWQSPVKKSWVVWGD